MKAKNDISTTNYDESQRVLAIVARIYGEHYPIFMAYAAKYTIGYGLDPAEVIQSFIVDRLLKMEQSVIEKIESRGLPILFGLLKNYAIDLYRKEKTRKKYEMEYTKGLPTNSSEDDSMDEESRNKKQREKILANTSLLSKREYETVHLILAGYRIIEIANMLSLNPKTISSLKNRSIQKLRNSLVHKLE